MDTNSAPTIEAFAASAFGDVSDSLGNGSAPAVSGSQPSSSASPTPAGSAAVDSTALGETPPGNDTASATETPSDEPQTPTDANPDGAPTPETPASTEPEFVAEPLTYTVNGEERTYDGIQVTEDGGIIDRDALPDVQTRLAERDHYESVARHEQQRYQSLERATEWKTTGPDGREQTLTGVDAIEASRSMLARVLAGYQVLSQALENPDAFAELVGVNEQGHIVPNARAIENLATRGMLAAERAERTTQAQYAQLRASQQQSTADARTQAQNDPATVAPALWQLADREWGKALPALSADDKQFLSAQVPRYLRPATDAEVSGGQFRRGQLVLDVSFQQLMQRTAQANTKAATTVSTATAAANANAKKLAAANSGRPSAAAPRAPAAAPTRPADTRSQDRFTFMQETTAGHFPGSPPGPR